MNTTEKKRVYNEATGLPYFDQDDLLETIKKLGAGGAHITTLVVKNDLRSQGFFAVQERVSEMMHSLAGAGVLEKENLGRWHEFWLKPEQPKHWSKSKQTWIAYKDMHARHLLNVIKAYLTALTNALIETNVIKKSDSEWQDFVLCFAELERRVREELA